MSFTTKTQEPTGPVFHLPDEFKNDYQNALKRKLKDWAEWREHVNDILAQGGTMEDVAPLESYLIQTDHPTENPKILLAYCASGENISPLRKNTFLHYGIPRVRNASSSSPVDSPSSPRTPTSPAARLPRSPSPARRQDPRRPAFQPPSPDPRQAEFSYKTLPSPQRNEHERAAQQFQYQTMQAGRRSKSPGARLHRVPSHEEVQRRTYAQSAIHIRDPLPDYEHENIDLISEPAPDYEQNRLRRSHENLLRSHDERTRDVRRSQENLLQAHDHETLERSRDVRRSQQDILRSHDENFERSREARRSHDVRRSHDSLDDMIGRERRFTYHEAGNVRTDGDPRAGRGDYRYY